MNVADDLHIAYEEGYEKGFNDGFEVGQRDVQPEQPIRCKDCKHRYVDGDGVRYNVCELNHNKVQSDDWFCADAERKEGADG